jgi:hypothetical protein
MADSWFVSEDMPATVRRVMATDEYLRDAEFLDGWLERETDLQDGIQGATQTDLLGLFGVGDKLGVLGIEAKVTESFGPLISEKLGGSEDARLRVRQLCDLFRLDPDHAGHLRYQLVHRTAAIILEARRFRSNIGVLIIQSFCPDRTGLSDCAAFFEAIGMSGFHDGGLIGARRFAGVDLWAGWASDVPLPEVSGLDAQASVFS